MLKQTLDSRQARYLGSLISNGDEFRLHAKGILTISRTYQNHQTDEGFQGPYLLEESIRLIANNWTFEPLQPKASAREFPAVFQGANVDTGIPLILDYLLWTPCSNGFDIDTKEIELAGVIPVGRSLPEPLP